MEPNSIKFEIIKKIAETNFRYRDLKNISKLDSNSPPSVFVGSRLRYPIVNVGILSPLERDENAWIYDDAKYWANNNFQIRDVLMLRDGLLNSRFQSKVQDARLNFGTGKKFVEIAKEIAIASNPVDVEIELKNSLRIKRKKDRILTPQGMRGSLKRAKIKGNVKVHKKLDKIINDEIKAVESVNVLYKSNFDEYILSKILSVGVLGLKKNKRLVPTRWSITATDDMLGKNILEKIKEYKWMENYELFFGEFMGNCYLLLFFPDVFTYELFELYLPNSSWNPSNEIKAATDYESYSGRKDYAIATGGGYYATRLPLLEYLNKEKRQASVLAIRIETPGYWAALGVWVVRESVRKALKKGGMKFDSKEELIKSAKKISKVKYNFDPEHIFKRSKLLRQIKGQKKLQEWLR